MKEGLFDDVTKNIEQTGPVFAGAGLLPRKGTSMKLFGKMTVIGVGLLGASLARACKERGLVEEITGYGRNRENLEKARALKVIDHCSTDLAEAVKDADLVVLCTHRSHPSFR